MCDCIRPPVPCAWALISLMVTWLALSCPYGFSSLHEAQSLPTMNGEILSLFLTYSMRDRTLSIVFTALFPDLEWSVEHGSTQERRVKGMSVFFLPGQD